MYHPADFLGFISRVLGQEVEHSASLTVLQLQVGPLVEEQLYCVRLTAHCSLMQGSATLTLEEEEKEGVEGQN